MTFDDGRPVFPISPPTIGEAGQTGTWRTRRPVIAHARCLTCRPKPGDCQICWMYCPEAAMSQGRPPTIDYRYCKGCGCCAKECPGQAIDMVPEE